MSRRLPAVALVVLSAFVAASGCSGEVVDISVTIRVDSESCPVADPGISWLPCGGAVGVWLLSEDGDVIEERCVPFDPEPLTVANLPELLDQVSFSALAGGDRVAIELAVYIESAGACPRFDPEIPEDPLPLPVYFGRSEVVEISASSRSLAVDLACYDLATQPCGDGWLEVLAAVTDLDTWEPVWPEPPLLSVSAGVVTREGNYAEQSLLEPQEFEWVGQILVADLPDQCVGVVAITGDSIWPFLSCQSTAVDAGLLVAQAYLLDASLIDPVLAAIAFEDSLFGLGLGRVVDQDNQPVSGVQLVPSDPGLTVYYLSSDMTSTDGESTAEHGYFVVLGQSPGCCYGFDEVFPYPAAELHEFGLVPELITLVPVRITL